jgi:hypothetical protein
MHGPSEPWVECSLNFGVSCLDIGAPRARTETNGYFRTDRSAVLPVGRKRLWNHGRRSGRTLVNQLCSLSYLQP